MIGGLLVFTIAACLGAEFAARYYERHRSRPPDYFPSIYYPHRRLRYGLIPKFDYYGWFHINSLGFRGREVSAEKRPGTLRIVCLGGSTTFDIASVGTALPWPEVLEGELRKRLGTQDIEVLNLGIGGATSLDSLIDLQMRALHLQPDLVIVFQGHNDLSYSIPPPTPENTNLFQLEDRPRSSVTRWLTYHSLLYAKAEERVGSRINAIMGGAKRLVGLSNDGVPEDRRENMERGFEDFRNNVTSIAAITRANHISLALVEAVIPFRAEGQPEGSCQMCDALSETYGHVDVATLKTMFGRYDGALQQAASTGPNVYYIATDGFVPSDDRYFHDPVHFGPEGSRQMGVKLGEVLAPIVMRLRADAANASASAAQDAEEPVAASVGK